MMPKKLDDLFYTLELRDEQFVQESQKIKKELGDVNDKMGKEMQATSKKTGSSMKKFFKSLAIGFAAIGGAVLAIKKALDFSKEGAKFNQQMQALEQQFGVSADKIIGKLREVSQGTISDQGLIEATNRAFTLNVTKDVNELAKLMEFARLRGRALGLDTTAAFNDIVTGIGRGSPLILDNLGIITKAWTEEAQATGQAVDSQFIMKKVLEQANEELEKQGELVLTDSEKLSVLTAKAENLKLSLSQAVGQGMRPLIDGLLKIDTAGDTANKAFEAISDTIETLIRSFSIAIDGIKLLLRAFVIAGQSIRNQFIKVRISLLKESEKLLTGFQESGLGKLLQISKDDVLVVSVRNQIAEAEKLLLSSNNKLNASYTKSENLLSKIIGNIKAIGTAWTTTEDSVNSINETLGSGGGKGRKGGGGGGETVNKKASELLSIVTSITNELLEGNKNAEQFVSTFSSFIEAAISGNIMGVISSIVGGIIKIFKQNQNVTEELDEQLTVWEKIQMTVDETNDRLIVTDALMESFAGNESKLLALDERRLNILKESNSETVKNLQLNKKVIKNEIQRAKDNIATANKAKGILGAFNIFGVNDKAIANQNKFIASQNAIIYNLGKQLELADKIGIATELNADGTIKNLEAFQELIDNEMDKDRRDALLEVLKINNDITDALKEQVNITDDINNSTLDRIKQEIALGILDPSNIRDIASIQSRLSASGLSGLNLGTSLQGLGVSGGAYNRATQIGSLTNIFNGVPTSDLTQQTADQVDNAIGGV